MSLREADAPILAGSGVIVLGALLGLLVGPEVGVALGAVGLALALVGIALAYRSLHRRLAAHDAVLARQRRMLVRQRRVLERQRARLRATADAAGATARDVGKVLAVTRRVEGHTDVLASSRPRTHQLVAETHQAVMRTTDQLARDSLRVRTSLDTLPSDIVRLGRAVNLLAPHEQRLPGLGDWAVTPATLLTMLEEVYRRSGPVTVLECGSGSSTAFLALALRERGQGGRVVALESDSVFAEVTRERLRGFDIDDVATVVDAPLVDVVVPGREEPALWFDLAGLPPDLPPVDLLFVDGPVGGSSSQARHPAFPLLASRLAPGAMVVLDDTDRADEQAILRQWLESDTGGRLEPVGRNVRSTFLRVRA
jgi:predicted O-methyltransferase YrrM